MQTAQILVFDPKLKKAQRLDVLDDEIERLSAVIDSQHKAQEELRASISQNRAKLRELKEKCDPVINKIVCRLTSKGYKERCRIIALSWGGGYSAIKIKSDGSESNAKDRWKQIYLDDSWSRWKLETRPEGVCENKPLAIQ